MARQAREECGTGIHVILGCVNYQIIFVEPEDIGNDGVSDDARGHVSDMNDGRRMMGEG